MFWRQTRASASQSPPLAAQVIYRACLTALVVALLNVVAVPQARSHEPAADSYGVIGCSNTAQSVEGYRVMSDLDLLVSGGLGGGSLGRWGDPTAIEHESYWSLYADRRPAAGYTAVVWQICLRDSEHDDVMSTEHEQWATFVIDKVRALDPGVTIHVMPLNFYLHECPATGAGGPSVAAAIADWAVAELGLARGPDLGPLDTTQVISDLCHLNGAGKDLVGGQLVDYLDTGLLAGGPFADVAAPLAVEAVASSPLMPASAVVTVGNEGDADLVISSVRATDPALTVATSTLPVTVPAGASIDLVAEVAVSAAMPFEEYLVIESNDPSEPAVPVAVSAPSTMVSLHVASNAAGGAYTTTSGVDFVPDAPFVAGGAGYLSGRISSTVVDIAGTDDDPIYQAARTGRAVGFAADALPAGDYLLVLHFADLTASKTGQNVFDVLVEGAIVADDLDLFATVGSLTAHTVQHTVSIGDGQLNVDLAAAQGRAVLSGVEVHALTTPDPVADISVAPGSVDFGSVAVGSVGSAEVVVTNSGGADLTVDSAVATGSGFSVSAPVFPEVLPPAGTATVVVEFVPAAAGAHTGTLTIVSDDPDQPSLDVPLNGSGVEAPVGPDIALAPASLGFGDVSVGTGASADVIISNAGGADLTVTSVTTTGAEFTATATIPSVVAPGGTMVVPVQFQPTAVGSFAGELTMGSDDPDTPTVVVPLTGEGISADAPAVAAVNAGGSEVTAASGLVFAADQAFVPGFWGYEGGTGGAMTASIAGTEDDALYQAYRAGAQIDYRFDGLASGSYTVTLHFAEPKAARVGARLFDVSAEGVLVLDDLDIFAAAGAANAALVVTFVAVVEDGQLHVSLTGVVRQALVAAIEVVPAPDS